MLKVHHFNNPSELLAATPKPYDPGDNNWLGMSPDKAVECIVKGDMSAVEGGEKFINKLEHSLVLPETFGHETVRSPFGARVNMGDWSAGSPTPMRRRVKRVSDISPVRIFVDMFCSASVTAATMRQRGEAITALVMLAQKVRPVDLYAIASTTYAGHDDGQRYISIHLDSRPISLSQVGFCIGHPSFFRCICIGFFRSTETTPTVPLLRRTREEQRKDLDLNPNDILIEKASGLDPLVNDPEQWIMQELTKMIGTGE